MRRVDTVRAALREASFYKNPNTTQVKVYHILAKPGLSACGRMLNDDSAIEAAQAPQGLRCQRTGCRARWPADGVPEVHHDTESPSGTDGAKPQ